MSVRLKRKVELEFVSGVFADREVLSGCDAPDRRSASAREASIPRRARGCHHRSGLEHAAVVQPHATDAAAVADQTYDMSHPELGSGLAGSLKKACVEHLPADDKPFVRRGVGAKVVVAPLSCDDVRDAKF